MPHHYILDVIDPLGRRVTLTPEAWDRHVMKRPAIQHSLALVQTTIAEPDFLELAHDGSYRYYRLGINSGRSQQYLHVPVRIEANDAKRGRIASAWYTSETEGEMSYGCDRI